MISGQWFQKKRSKNWKTFHKITHNSIQIRGSILICILSVISRFQVVSVQHGNTPPPLK